MGIKKFNPYTPSRRHMTSSDYSEITTNKPEKSLTTSLKKNAGRNNQGKITVRHHGGGSRRKYRIIDFKRKKDGIPATVKSIEYDPNRTANIALICYADGEKAYILAPAGLQVGQTVMNGSTAEINVGNCLALEDIPVGTEVHNIELYPGRGGQLVRSAGNSAQHINAQELKNAIHQNRIYVMHIENKFIGWLRYNLFWDNMPFLNVLYLLEDYRGKGYGTVLIDFWERKMSEKNYGAVLTSTLSNEQAQFFYRKNVYVDCSSLLLPGEPLEIIMLKQLKEES